MNACRIEKAYRHWGHDIADEDTPLEAGLGFAVAWDKPGGFIGREALLKQKKRKVCPSAWSRWRLGCGRECALDVSRGADLPRRRIVGASPPAPWAIASAARWRSAMSGPRAASPPTGSRRGFRGRDRLAASPGGVALRGVL